MLCTLKILKTLAAPAVALACADGCAVADHVGRAESGHGLQDGDGHLPHAALLAAADGCIEADHVWADSVSFPWLDLLANS